MRRAQGAVLRVAAGALMALLLAACGGGINAGEEGGRAFVAFALMLVITLGALWIAIGRGD